MSRRIVLAGLGCITLLASGAYGQSAEELKAREQRLRIVHDQAQQWVRASDSAEISTLDTVREGILTVLVPPQVVPNAREAMRRVLPKLLFAYGDASAVLSDTFRAAHHPPAVAAFATRRDRPPFRGVFPDPGFAAYRLENDIARRAELAFGTPAGHAYQGWRHNPVVSPFSQKELADGLTRTYVDLVTAPSPATGECFQGDLAQCRIALGIVAAEDPATQWYTAAGRRAVIRDNLNVYQRMSSETARNCIQGSDEACLATFRAMDPDNFPPPLDWQVREILTQYALHLGGSGSYIRFLNETGDISHVLAAASGVSMDSLLSRWRPAVIAARPERMTTTPAAGWMALFWASAFGVLALKGPRWLRT